MPSWTAARARKHALNDAAYRGDKQWTGSPLQVFLLAEKDFKFNAEAFHHILPCSRIERQEDANEFMAEAWRKSDQKVDLGYFRCTHCRQYSKHGFCEHVSTVTCLNLI